MQMMTLTSFAHNLANQKNWIFLLGQILPLALSTRDLHGYEMGVDYLLSYELELSKSWVWVEVELSLSYQKTPFSPFLFLFLVFSAFLWLVGLKLRPYKGNET